MPVPVHPRQRRGRERVKDEDERGGCPGSFEFQDFGDNENFEALSRGFNSHCLRFVPVSLLTTQDSLPVVG